MKSVKLEYVTTNIVATEALFVQDGVDFESLGLTKVYEPCEFRFNIREICTYNPGSDDQTVLRFKNGDCFKINMDFDTFDSKLIELLKQRNK